MVNPAHVMRNLQPHFDRSLIEDVYEGCRLAHVGFRDRYRGIVWVSPSLEDYLKDQAKTNAGGIRISKVKKNISEKIGATVCSFAFDGLVAKIDDENTEGIVGDSEYRNLRNFHLLGKEGGEVKVSFLYSEKADSLSNVFPSTQVGDMVRVFALPLDGETVSSGTLGFYLRNYSLEQGLSGSNSENPTFQEELTRTKFPDLDDKIVFGDGEYTIRESTKKFIDLLREDKGSRLRKFKKGILSTGHNGIFPELEEAVYEGLIDMVYAPQPLADSRKYGMRLFTATNVSLLRFLFNNKAAEEIFIPDGDHRFISMGRSLNYKGSFQHDRVKRLNDSVPHYEVSNDKLDEFFTMCAKAREGTISSSEIVSMLN